MSAEEDGGFLSRWSRRKRAAPEAAAAADAETATGGAAAEAPPGAAAGADAVSGAEAVSGSDAGPAPDPRSEAEILAELGLPLPESLKKGDDVRAFMARAVPEALRRRALRQLWRTDPILANLDGLNDYDGDFTGGFVPPGTLKTAWELGRGFAGRAEDVLAAADPDSGGDASRTDDGGADDGGADEGGAAAVPDAPAAASGSSVRRDPEPAPAPPPRTAEAPGALREVAGDTAGDAAHHAAGDGADEAPPAATRRRMRFTFPRGA